MSSTYNLEPPPTGKVILKTTQGDLVLELFAKQAPLASRNFLQHCLDGYYDNTIFHRLVPGFILQGGDPTGLGTGGVGALDGGKPFADEFHSRLRFNRRGLLGMANSGPNDNASQFFLTLDKTAELQGKNTMFGRIEGDTIYNLIKMGEAELAQQDRPLYPTKILGAEILLNPFEDMIKRVAAHSRQETTRPTKKRKAAKVVLTFDDDEPPLPVIKKAKVNPDFRVVDLPDQDQAKQPQKVGQPVEQQVEPQAPIQKVQHPVEPQVKQAVPKSPAAEHVETMTALERTNKQIAALKQSMKRSNTTIVQEQPKRQSALDAMIPANAVRGRKRGKPTTEPGALDAFNAFRQKLIQPASDTHPTSQHQAADNQDEEAICDLHFIANCQSCKAWDKEDNDEQDVNDGSWLGHSLSFAKDTLGKDLEWKRKMEGLETIDPRENKNEPRK